jgi:hypothetical protein
MLDSAFEMAQDIKDILRISCPVRLIIRAVPKNKYERKVYGYCIGKYNM